MKKQYLYIVMALAAMTFSGCTHEEREHEEHEHLQLTAYSDKVELYAEAEPMVAGQEGHILCHLTSLDKFKPVAGAEVTMTANIGGKSNTYKASSTDNEGIYKVLFTPEAEGLATLVFTIKGNGLNTSVTVKDIRIFTNEEEAEEYAEEKEIKNANAVNFTKEMSWGIDFATSPVKYQPLGNVIHTVAQVQPSQGGEYTITAKVDGVVSLSGSSLTEGCDIKAGQAICSIDASSTASNNLSVQQNQANAEYERARKEYERLKTLREEKLVTESEYANAKATYESAEAAYKALSKGYGKGFQTISAANSGYLKQLMVKNGQYVTAGETIAIITQSRTVTLKAEVPASHYSDLARISGANIRKINSKEECWTLEQLGGRILSYGKQTNTTNPLLPVLFEINNVVDLVPGCFVDMYIQTRSENTRACVPYGAVIEEMGHSFVYVQLTPELFEKRQVVTGVTDGINIEITDGLRKDERVVSRGAIMVKLQHASGGVDPESGHSHSH